MITNQLEFLGRSEQLFGADLRANEREIARITAQSRFLVLGGGGSIGQAVVKALFERNPHKLHVVDLSENSLVELVRDLRSSLGYTYGEFKTFAVDIGSAEFDLLFNKEGPYDFVLNLSALKHVRSERDPYSLMRMVRVNVMNTLSTLNLAESINARYFAVSTDKATDPVNLMGATKLLMEKAMFSRGAQFVVSSARFANVAFSDGSLLSSFESRLKKRQPLVAPTDVHRYFITSEEAGLLCLLSALIGGRSEILFPKPGVALEPTGFDELAVKFLAAHGFEPRFCSSEEEARELSRSNTSINEWPCYFAPSNTTGEKEIEEFFSETDELELNRFEDIGVIKARVQSVEQVEPFVRGIEEMLVNGTWTKAQLVNLMKIALPNLSYQDLGFYLDQKM